jgi:hypothetical protein
MKNNVFRANFGVDSSQVKRHSLAPHAMSLQLSRRCAVSVPHVFRCPVGPAHRPRNSTSHERSLIPPPACLFVVLTPFFPPTNPLPFYQFFIYIILLLHKRRAAAKTSRKGASERQQAAASAHPPSLPSAPASLCRRHLRFLWRKREASEGSERASERGKYSTDTTHLPLLAPPVRPPSRKSFAAYYLPFLFLPPPSAQRAHARTRREARPPRAGRRSISFSLRWILRPLAARWSGDPAARASAASSLFCR